MEAGLCHEDDIAGLCMLHLSSTEIVPTRAKMAVACVLGGCNSLAHTAMLYWLWKE